MDPVNVIILILVGGLCGWLETRHIEGRGLGLIANVVLGIVGALLSGYFFSVWGQLAQGYLAPVASAPIGAAIVLPIVNWIVARTRGAGMA
jgi:uncharacterized membrane protein YeaQ/YmgE (transglycosylase-associated protein family)